MSAVDPTLRKVGLPPGTTITDLMTTSGITLKIQPFQKKERARLAFEESPEGEARALRRRIAKRGGAQSTILTRSLLGGPSQSSVFARKGNLGGTR